MREHLSDLAALQAPDEVPREYARIGLCLGDEVLGSVLADEVDPRLGQDPQLADGHVLHRSQDLDLADIPARRRDLLTRALQICADRLGPQSRYRLNHTTPAWRPVIPPSRRWENIS